MKIRIFPSSGKFAHATELAWATTRLDLLADIDATVDALAQRAADFSDFSRVLSHLTTEISNLSVVAGEYLDPDAQKIDVFRKAESALESYLPRMLAKRASIDLDDRLSAEHRESLHDAYEEAITNAALLHEDLMAVRLATLKHDLNAEPTDDLPVFSTIDALLSDLRR
ncbi:MAG: hypothetical protein LBJ76_00810 [Candidatus Accumulibacter sp.]|jgi:hypothetical protein|nr:hypothetical protein [Accumulibacter sp.]